MRAGEVIVGKIGTSWPGDFVTLAALSALMRLRVIYVLTHDSIGLGEDGPTHQPIEHLAMLRATPQPDGASSGGCNRNSGMLGDRASIQIHAIDLMPLQEKPAHRANTHAEENLCARGAYVLVDAVGPRDITLLATGSEVQIAIEAAKLLAAEPQVRAAVVSMPAGSHSNLSLSLASLMS